MRGRRARTNLHLVLVFRALFAVAAELVGGHRAGLDVKGPEIVAIHPAPNENAWLLGQAALREKSLLSQQHVGMVGARGIAPRVTRSSGIWIPRLYRGRVLVTMGGVRPPLRSVRSA